MNAELATRVFEAILARFRASADDLARFTATHYSFEEWLNWEAFAACCGTEGWEVYPKPRYCDLGAADCKDFGDLLVVEGDTKVLVEVGLVHDGTTDKWRYKLEWDVEKLARPMDGITSLQLVVLVSERNIDGSEMWQRWLEKIPCWDRPTSLAASFALPPIGQAILRAWTTEPSGHSALGSVP